MTFGVNVELADPRGVVGKMHVLTRAAHDLRPFFEQIEGLVYAHFKSWLGSSGSGTWKPLSKSYAAWKAVHYPGTQILEREGRLFASLEPGSGADIIREISSTEARWGTRVPYAVVHQRSKRPQLPVRRVVLLTSELRLQFLAEARTYLVESLARAA